MPLERGKMHPEDERRIRKNIVNLKKIDPMDLVDYFIQEELLDFPDIGQIKSYNPDSVANRWQGFAHLLFDCGPRAYKSLLLALEKCNHIDLANSIRRTQLAAPKQCVDAENRDCFIQSLQSELVKKNRKIQQLERVCSQKSCFPGRTIEISPSNDGDHLSSSSQSEIASPNNVETSSQSDVSNYSTRSQSCQINVSPCKKPLYERIESFTVVTIKDNTASVSVALWGPAAENIQKGQVVALENVKVKLFNNEKQLTNTRTSTVKVISNEQLSQLSEDDDDEDNLKTGTIIGLIEIEPYSSCPVMQCRNTKLKTAEKDGMLKCPKHGQLVAPEAAHLFMYARFHVQTIDSKICTLVAFMPILKLLLEAKAKKFNLTFNKQILERDIISTLPYSFRFHEKNGIIESVCPKRRIQS